MKRFIIFMLLINFLALRPAVPPAYGQTQGVVFSTLAAFNATNNGANPYDPPFLGADGNLYGTLPYGGTNNFGVIFKVTTNGSENTFYNFSNWDGAVPIAPLISGTDGNFYGVAAEGGTNNQGTIFEITTNGTFTLLYSFGMTTNAPGYALDGAKPYGGLVQGRDGNYYGTTSSGGASNLGTIFQFSTNGVLTTLHSFTGNGTNDDGAAPYLTPLVEGADGVFYGTTSAGGTNNYGTIFQITADGTLATLFEFNGADGQNPWAGLSFGTDGNLYGTTPEGGTNGYGTAFQITTNGVLTTLFHFGGTDGLSYPYGGVVPGNNNTLFGTSYQGGAGYGAVFQLTTNGLLTRLHSFTYSDDGANPVTGVIRDAGGNLYGTALYGGTNGGYGTVYRLSFTTLLSILSPAANELWSNGVFTASGTASDNAPGGSVTNVFYSMNGAPWTGATTENGWINWTAGGLLAPGTNTIAAYAVDSDGKDSATNTVSFVHVAVLTVTTNGVGSLSTNYNGAVLPVGNRYSITATAGSGFVFTNWTGGTNLPLSIITNKPTVQFVMEPDLTLQANFLDLSKPTLSITNLVSGQRVSNAVFTVKGKAGDNWRVTNVFYLLNGGDWTTASTTNNWTNWAAAVALSPGTNTVAAYAVDPAGASSPTNAISFQFVVTNQLQIRAAGLGTISPNYSNAWLEVGRNYTMTASPGGGFVVTNWVISTNWIGGTATNNVVLHFMMASNLTLQVNFLDITKPTLTVSSPAAGQHMTNALANLTGTAGDNWKVAGVWYQLNSNAWDLVNTTNGYTNWNRTVALLAGTNTLKLYSQDLGGNHSTTNNLNVVSGNAFKLQLAFAAGQPLASNGLNFVLLVSTGLVGHVQVSTNLVNWAAFTNFTGTNVSLNFRDAAATNYNQRFYRAVIP
jgi:uncharacterized repeat protein (TIGR03803 family)